ncbi:MAG: hypothetical protein C5B58_08185 [Acidobacteria bacterium]|nr:MAG: hypothetical protein C5B58_08185 [Acidobacteriota bacterium]
MKSLNSKLRSGAALMLALWALFLLSAMIISWALDINSRLAVSGNANRVLEAQAMASSGAEVALNPDISPGSPNLHRQMGDRESYDVQMTGECGRLNLNLLIPGGQENQAYVEILRRYLVLKGVELNERDRMVDSLLDWISPTRGFHRLNACPETEDYRPPHIGRLDSVDELKKVCGWEEFTSKPGWDEDFTVVGGCGTIALAWASRDVLRALEIGDDRVDRFLQLRRGSDGIDGTADDLHFGAAIGGKIQGGTTGGSMPPEVQATLGLTPEWFSKYQNLVTFESLVSRIVSAGKSGDITRSVQMIVSKAGGARGLQVISWKEL